MTTQIRPNELIRLLKPEFLSIGSGGGVHAGPGIDIVGGVTVGIGYDTILLYDSALAVAAEFAATNVGFAAAIAAAGAGDCIQLPMTLTLTAAHTINGDIILRGPCTITANGDYANLLTLNGGATADNIKVNYMTTTAAGGAAIYSSTGCYLRHVNAIIGGNVGGVTCGANLIDIDPNSRINDCYFEATGDFGGIARYGLRITSPGGGTRNRLVVEGCIGYAHNNTAAARCYGIHIAGSASIAGEVKFTILDGCIGYGYAQWNNGIGWGIYAEDCLLDSCIGYGNGGDTIGIHIVNAYAFSCSGHAAHEATGVQEAIGILVGGNGEAYSCRAVVTTTAGTEYGFYCDGADPIVCGGYGHGDTADIYVDAGTTAHIRSVAYDSIAGAGTLSLLAGDRVVMDLDGDTYVTALITDDEIHVYVNGAEDFRITANTLNVLVGSGIGMADDTWIGLGAGAGSLVFDVTPAPDQVKVSDADFNFITAAHGIIHVDGVAAGELLLADGTRYVPSGWFLVGTAGQTYTFPAAGGTIPTGTGVANRVAYWSGINTLTSDAGLWIDAPNDMYIVVDAGGIGNTVATARLMFDSSGVTDYAYFMSCNLGVGTAAAQGVVEARRDQNATTHMILNNDNLGTSAAAHARFAIWDGAAERSYFGMVGDAAAVNDVIIGNRILDNNADILFALRDGTHQHVMKGDGKIGFGTITVPHGGIGWASLAIEGTNASVNGPHMQFTTDTDNYPLLQILPYSHDSIAISFDTYWDGAQRSSDVGSNFQIFKYSDTLRFRCDQGIAQGNVVTWVNAFVIDKFGNIGMNITAPLAKCHIDQSSTTAAIPVLTLDQADVSDGFINFIGSDRGVITGATNSLKSVRVELAGTVYRLALYVNA